MPYLAYANDNTNKKYHWNITKKMAIRWLEKNLGTIYRGNFDVRDCYGHIWYLTEEMQQNFNPKILENLVYDVFMFINGNLVSIVGPRQRTGEKE